VDTSIDFEERFREVLKAVGREKNLPKIGDEPTEEYETDEGDEGEKTADEKALPPPTTINLFQHPDAHPLVLDLALLREYRIDWFDWEPETLAWRIPRDFKTSVVSDLNMNKIQAVKTLHFVDTFWNQWEVFNWCTQPFNNLYPDFEVMQVPTVAQCLVSIDTANKIRTDVKFGEEIKGFLETVYRTDGMFCPLEPADFVEIDAEGLLVDCEEVQKHWPEVKRSGRAPTKDTITDEQLRRALNAHNYLEENRTLLQQQLPLVLNA
jgi:hypothetical protein